MPLIVFALAVLITWTVVFARTMMQLTQRTLEILNLALVVNFLALRQFQRLEHFFHLLERMFQFFDDAVDLVDRVRDGWRFMLRFRLLLLLPPLSLLTASVVVAASITIATFIVLPTPIRLGLALAFAALLTFRLTFASTFRFR
jgi:hypothetical protein